MVSRKVGRMHLVEKHEVLLRIQAIEWVSAPFNRGSTHVM